MNAPLQTAEANSFKRLAAVLWTCLRFVGVLAAVAAVTALDYKLQVNSATAGFTYLVLILALSTRFGLAESISASVLSVAAYNFYFLPPVGTFTIADPQNWIALFALLATAFTATHLASSARKRAEEARARQTELQRMYDFSRGLMLGNDEHTLGYQIVEQIARSFELPAACFYDAQSELFFKVDDTPEPILTRSLLAEVAVTGRHWTMVGRALVIPVRLGGANLGSLGVAGPLVPSSVAFEAIAQLVAIALERAQVLRAASRLEAAQQSEQLKSTLLDALAHEFKTPLTSVKAVATTLLSSSLSEAEQRGLINILDEETDRMTRLVDDSLELARIGSSPLALHREVCDVQEVISSAIDSVRGLLEGRVLEQDIAPDLPPVLVDRHLSELALRQILNNAVKYSQSHSEIGVRAVRESQFILISVLNLGPPILKAEQQRIFEKFYRGPDVRTRVAGTGLGLSIAAEIVEAQGGRITVLSESQLGTRFTLSLPVSTQRDGHRTPNYLHDKSQHSGGG